jgi:outer membrane protein assembly factor BamB
MDRDTPRPARTRIVDTPVVLIGLLALAPVGGWSADWPQYRGLNHDGISSEPIRTNWVADPPRQVWKVPLGPAFSSLAVAGGRVFTQENRATASGPREFCVAIDTGSGQVLWSSDALDQAVYQSGAGDDDGPRSTPAVAGDRVVVLTSYLNLVCLNATNGARIWTRNLTADYGSQGIQWQNAASPLIDQGLILLNCNGRAGERFVAFRLEDGTEAWKGGSDGLTHSSPVLATLAGVHQAIFFTQLGLVGINPQSGAVLWRHALNYNLTSVAASPVVDGDLVYASRAYPGSLTAARAGAVVVRVSQQGGIFTATRVWGRTNALMNHWCTPVQVQGHLYGMYGQSSLTFSCVDMNTGTNRWSLGGFGYGSVLGAGGLVLALTEPGELVLVQPNPAAYTELGRHRALTGKCWNVPAISNGRIYVRSTAELACLDIGAPAPPGVVLRPQPPTDGTFQLVVAADGDLPLDAARAAKIAVEATDQPVGSTWEQVAGDLMLIDSQWILRDASAETQPHRFYRAVERP